MKKAMLTFGLLLMTVIGLSANANAQAFQAVLTNNDNQAVQIIANQGGTTFDVIYSKEEASKVKVNIFNDNHRVVFTEVMRSRNEFRRPYNLENLPRGSYTFQITDASGTYEQVVQVN